MVQENEVAMLILGLIVLVFKLMYHSTLKRVPHNNYLFIAYCLLVVGFAATVAESFFLYTYLNLLEHLSYAISAGFMAGWFWKVFNGKEVH